MPVQRLRIPSAAHRRLASRSASISEKANLRLDGINRAGDVGHFRISTRTQRLQDSPPRFKEFIHIPSEML